MARNSARNFCFTESRYVGLVGLKRFFFFFSNLVVGVVGGW